MNLKNINPTPAAFSLSTGTSLISLYQLIIRRVIKSFLANLLKFRAVKLQLFSSFCQLKNGAMMMTM